MAATTPSSSSKISWLTLVFTFLTLLVHVSGRDPVYISGVGYDGKKSDSLDVSRTPSLYTGDFADCLDGGSLFNVTKFDAAYYADNLTVLFHFDGTTNLRKESLIRKYLAIVSPAFNALTPIPQFIYRSMHTGKTDST